MIIEEKKINERGQMSIELWEVGSIVPLKDHYLRINLFQQKDGRLEQNSFDLNSEVFQSLVAKKIVDFSNCGIHVVSLLNF